MEKVFLKENISVSLHLLFGTLLVKKKMFCYVWDVCIQTHQFSCKMILILPNFSKTQYSSSKQTLSNFIKFILHSSTCSISTDKRSYYNKNSQFLSMSWIKALSENEWMGRNMVNHVVFCKGKLQVTKILQTQNLNMIIF